MSNNAVDEYLLVDKDSRDDYLHHCVMHMDYRVRAQLRKTLDDTIHTFSYQFLECYCRAHRAEFGKDFIIVSSAWSFEEKLSNLVISALENGYNIEPHQIVYWLIAYASWLSFYRSEDLTILRQRIDNIVCGIYPDLENRYEEGILKAVPYSAEYYKALYDRGR